MAKTKNQVRSEALDILRKKKRAGVGISMGVGKTRLGLEHFQLVVNKFKETKLIPAKGLIVAPTKKIIQGWKDEAKKWDMEELLDNLIFSTYRSLSKNTLDYDVVYLDECHSLKISHNEWLSLHEGYVVGLTGTPPKYKGSEKQKMIEFAKDADILIHFIQNVKNILNILIFITRKIRRFPQEKLESYHLEWSSWAIGKVFFVQMRKYLLNQSENS